MRPSSAAARPCSDPAVLASMLSPSWGVYAGYELEHVARPGAEYLDNGSTSCARAMGGAEKAGESLAPYLARLNQIRQSNRAPLAASCASTRSTTTRCWSGPNATNATATRCSVSPARLPQRPWKHHADMPALGFDWHGMLVVDELTESTSGGTTTRCAWIYREPAHVFAVHRNGAAVERLDAARGGRHRTAADCHPDRRTGRCPATTVAPALTHPNPPLPHQLPPRGCLRLNPPRLTPQLQPPPRLHPPHLHPPKGNPPHRGRPHRKRLHRAKPPDRKMPSHLGIRHDP
jgi:starch synthase (maltosyl-transferring)